MTTPTSTDPTEVASRPVVAIYVTTGRTDGHRQRFAAWVGDPGWLSMPGSGDNWAHCGEWTGETFRRVWWNGPKGGPPHTAEVDVTHEVFDHLVAEHGFAETG